MIDTIHKKEEFHNFPFNKEWDEHSMTFGIGGHGFKDGTWSIAVIKNQDCDADIWELPDVLQYVLSCVREMGRNDTKNEIKNYLSGIKKILGNRW